MIYVLLVIALFAALGFLLARGGGSSETSSLTEEKANIFTSQIMGSPMQMKQALDTMVYSGSKVYKALPDDVAINYALPQDSVQFASGSNGNKFFHPEGGGAVMPHLPEEVVAKASGATPDPGWYIARFNNVAWTPTDYEDVIMTAWQISKKICENINEKLTGSPAIPVLADDAKKLILKGSLTGSGNIEFSSSECSECDGQPAMCVQDKGGGAAPYAFYSIIGAE
jgi:hypothetical protein